MSDIPTAARELQAAILDRASIEYAYTLLPSPQRDDVADDSTSVLHAACDAMNAACIAVERTLVPEGDYAKALFSAVPEIGTLAEEASAWFGALMVLFRKQECHYGGRCKFGMSLLARADEYRAALRNLRIHTARVRGSV